MKTKKTIRLVFNLVFICFLISGCASLEHLIKKGDLSKAEKYCESRKGEKRIECYRILAKAYLCNGNIGKAAEYYGIINNKEGLKNVADTYYDKGNYEDASKYYEKAGDLQQAIFSKPISISKTFIGRVDLSSYADGHYRAISPHGNKFAYVIKISGKFHAVIDGAKGKGYDAIVDEVYWRKTGITFSPDGKRVAYTAKIGNQWCVVLDGKEEQKYDAVSEVVFSPDGKRVAYIAQSGNKHCVIIDGKKEKKYINIIGGPIFSPDSKRTAYVVEDTCLVKDKCYNLNHAVDYCNKAVIDGIEGKMYLSVRDIVFSPDSRRVAYQAYPFVVLDDIEGVEILLNFLYRFITNSFVVVDDIEVGPFHAIDDGPIFSPDSKHVAYTVLTGDRDYDGKEFVMVDNIRGKEYRNIVLLGFSTNSLHIIYAVISKIAPFISMLVIDDIEVKNKIESENFEDIDLNSLYISNGKVAFKATKIIYSWETKKLPALPSNFKGSIPSDYFSTPWWNRDIYEQTPSSSYNISWVIKNIEEDVSLSKGLHPRLQVTDVNKILKWEIWTTEPQHLKFPLLNIDLIDIGKCDEVIGPIIESTDILRFIVREGDLLFLIEKRLE